MLTPEGHTAVDAAHIVPWRVRHDDRVGNGLALCWLCHWAFDEELLGVSGKYTSSPRRGWPAATTCRAMAEAQRS